MDRKTFKLLIACCVMLTLVGCAGMGKKGGEEGKEGKKGNPAANEAAEKAEQEERKAKAEAKKNAELKKKMDQAMNALNNVNNGGVEVVPGGVPDAAPVALRAKDGETLLARQAPQVAPALNNPVFNPMPIEALAVHQPQTVRGLSSTVHDGLGGKTRAQDI